MAIKRLKKSINFEKAYYYFVLLFAFTLPLSRASVSAFTILLPLLWLLEGNYKKKWLKIQKEKSLIFLLLFIFFSLLSTLWTQNMEDAYRPLRMFTYLGSAFVIATALDKKYIYTIISAFLYGMLISEIIAYGVYFELWHFKHATPQSPSPFMFHIDYSVFLAFTSILLLNRLVSKRYNLKEKILIALFFTTVTGNLFLSIGRTGQVALIVAVIVMSILHFRLSIKTLFLSSIFLIALYSLAYFSSPNFKARVIFAQDDISKVLHSNYNSSWGIRALFWRTTANIVLEHPFGVGIGDFMDATKAELQNKEYDKLISADTKEFMSTNHPHNEYLLILLESGIIGLIIFLTFLFYFVKLQIEDKELKELALLFITIYMVSFLAEPLLIKQFPVALFALFLGIFITANSKNLT